MSRTVNRCPHICPCPSDRECPHYECGCPLDFECPHDGTCESEAECTETPDATGAGTDAA